MDNPDISTTHVDRFTVPFHGGQTRKQFDVVVPLTEADTQDGYRKWTSARCHRMSVTESCATCGLPLVDAVRRSRRMTRRRDRKSPVPIRPDIGSGLSTAPTRGAPVTEN